ncbi:hypothetical protein PROPEN_04225 [Proteus penneri ATCC 35198]|nr:hypothetical protein PROPEN_04225 [Proteus penneri ATCC 35198]
MCLIFITYKAYFIMILQKKIKMKYQGNKFSFFLSTPFLTKLNSDLIKNKTTIKIITPIREKI